MKIFLKLAALLLFAVPLSATTYYVDFATGADTNNGTSKVTPWKHAKGMLGCTNLCNSTAILPGDSVILKGNVTWPNASLGWLINYSGNASSTPVGCSGAGCVYVGVDQTWFAPITGTVNTSGTAVTWISGVHGPGGGCNTSCNLFGDFTTAMAGGNITINSVVYTIASVSDATHLTLTGSAGTQTGVASSINVWGRPVLDGGGASVGNASGAIGTFVRIYANYVIFEQIEMKGMFWTGTPGFGNYSYLAYGAGTPGVGTHNEARNLYIHGWSHGTRASPTCTTEDDLVIGDSSVPNNNIGTSVHDSFITGLDVDRTSGASGTIFFGAPPYVYRNYVEYVSNGAIGNGMNSYHDNTIRHIGPTFQITNSCGGVGHTNGIEINTTSNKTTIYNNWIDSLGTGALGIFVGPLPGFPSYIFNNVLTNMDNSPNIIDPGAADPAPNPYAITNIVGNGVTATVTTPGTATVGVNGHYTIAGNSNSGFNVVISNPTPLTSNTFSFASAVNATGTGGTYQCVNSFQNTCDDAGASIIFNNTAEGGQDASPPNFQIANFSHAGDVSLIQNNYAITGAGGSGTVCTGGWCTNPSGTAPTVFTNVPLSKAAANANGQSYAQTFPFSPTSGSLGTGTSITSICSAISAFDATAGTACSFDTTLGVAIDRTAATVTGSTRTAISRPFGSPNVGAYQFASVGPPAVSLTPSSLTFTQNISGTSPSQTATLTNTGGSDLTISQISISGFFSQTNNCPFGPPLTAGSSCTFQITFSPVSTGIFSGTLTVTDNATGSPHTVALSGTGTAPVISLTPGSYAFGAVPTGTTAISSNFTLQNTGNGPLQPTLTIGGTDPTFFGVNFTDCPPVLPIGNSCTIRASFSPAIVTNYSATLVVTDSTIPLSASANLTGTGATVGTTPVAPWAPILLQ